MIFIFSSSFVSVRYQAFNITFLYTIIIFLCSAQPMILLLMHFHNGVSFTPLYYKETGSGVLRGVFHKRLTFSFSLVSVRYQAVNITFSLFCTANDRFAYALSQRSFFHTPLYIKAMRQAFCTPTS